jgi:hypothetical protein
MRRHSMSERSAWKKLSPKKQSDWHQIRVLGGYLSLMGLFIAAVVVSKYIHHKDLEHNWQSATAIIEDVRPKIIARIDSDRGGAMLYEVSVLVSYNLQGAKQERWVTVEQQPKSLAEAELQGYRWKGKEYLVRWKVSNPDHVIAEIS